MKQKNIQRLNYDPLKLIRFQEKIRVGFKYFGFLSLLSLFITVVLGMYGANEEALLFLIASASFGLASAMLDNFYQVSKNII